MFLFRREMFSFPENEYIPAITSQDLLQHLSSYMKLCYTAGRRVELPDFMEYLTSQIYKVQDGGSLGVRLRMGLAFKV